MRDHRQAIGHWGEQVAADYLLKQGYTIADRNVRTPYGEIDLIAQREALTIMVEVKARTSRTFGYPEEAVNGRKQAHLLSAVEHYAQQKSIDHWQVDVIAIEGQPGSQPKITHFENVLS
jgi:putative endonuclease